MGLVIQGPPDSLFAPLATKQPAEAAGADAKQGDLFAALLASLTGDTSTDSTQPSASALLAGVPAESEARPDDSNADVPAVMAAMQLLAQLNPILPGPVNGGQNIEGAVSTGATPMALAESLAQAADLDLAASASTDSAPTAGAEDASASTLAAAEALTSPVTVSTPASPAAQSATATTAATELAGQPTAGQVAPTTAQPTTAAAIATTATVTAEAAVRAAARDGDKPEATKRKDEPAAVAPEPPGSNPVDSASVVRSAGNAGQQGQGNPNPGGEKDHSTPNASLQGVAHAAANSAVGELRPADTAAVDTAEPAPTPVALPEAVEHVGRTIIEKVDQGGGEARLTLRPEALGEVVLHIHTEGDRVRVEIRAEHAEAANLLRDHTEDLSQLLGQRGLTLTDVYVGLGGQGSNNQQNESPAWAQPRQQADNSFASLLGIDEPGAADRSNRLRSAYNPDGAMSYRV